MRSSLGGRVLLYVNSLELGGSQINAIELADAVREFGYESFAVGPADSRRKGASLFDVAADRGVPLLAIDRPTSTLGGALALSGLAQGQGADIVHVYGTWSQRPSFWGPCYLGRRPLVQTVYEMAVDPIVFRHTSLIVGTGYLLDELAERPGGVTLISPPVDLDRDRCNSSAMRQFLHAHQLSEQNLRIVIVSRLDGEPLRPAKTTAIFAAMRALTRLPRSDVDVVIVGTGKDEQRLRQEAAEVNVQLGRRACVLTGAMADPRPAYASASVVVGMGGSAARGLAFGKPLIVSGEFGTFDTFSADRADQLFHASFWSEERRDDPVDVLLKALRPLLDDSSLRERLGAFGRGFAERNFGLPAMAERLAATYLAANSYAIGDWAADLRLESRWAGGWLAGRLLPESTLRHRATEWSTSARFRAGSHLTDSGGLQASPPDDEMRKY